MTDRPIIFSAPMIKALLDGRKTQTRRILSLRNGIIRDRSDACDCVRFFVGDRLWVREAFVTGFNIADESGCPVGPKMAWYRATDRGLSWYDPDTESTLDNPPWRPSIHMPRWASRLTLTVTDVRVQRLQDISEADAVAEGVSRLVGSEGPNHFSREIVGKWSGSFNAPTAKEVFADLWGGIHGGDAWDANPWVCAISFTVARRNIDEVAK